MALFRTAHTSTQIWIEVMHIINYYKNASFGSYSTFVHFFVRISSYKYAYFRRWVCSCRRV